LEEVKGKDFVRLEINETKLIGFRRIEERKCGGGANWKF
jgi:hypothetical protein